MNNRIGSSLYCKRMSDNAFFSPEIPGLTVCPKIAEELSSRESRTSRMRQRT
jgi:hypothetical protein